VTQPLRDWSLTRIKNEREADRCRVCKTHGTEMAHIIGREADHYSLTGIKHRDTSWIVYPDRVVPLCHHHHDLVDTHRFDLLPYLTLDEQVQAVRDARGLEKARIRLCPSAYGPSKVPA
jgi:hypothetical protein